MTNTMTPTDAFNAVSGVLPILSGLGPLVVSGKPLREYQQNIQIIGEILKREPTEACCQALECCVAIAGCTVDASKAFKKRSAEEKAAFLTAIGSAGVACNIAGRMGIH